MEAAPIQKFADYLDSLTPQSLDHLPNHYCDDIKFHDPINTGDGLEDLRAIFEDLFKHLKNVKVEITMAFGDSRQGFVRWIITYNYFLKPRRIDGVSHITFATDGKVASQDDFWDASHVVYGEFPVIGLLLRTIRRLVRVRPKK